MSARGEFVHLHNHTNHSVLDGHSRLDAACEAASDDGAGAIGITDHGTLSGAWKFAAAARRQGLRPVLGCEIYLSIGSRKDKDALAVPADDAGDLDGRRGEADSGKTKAKRYEHLTVLARNPQGWRNLVWINNDAQDPDHSWHKPRTDLDTVADHSDGLVILTGCLGGPVAGSLLRGDTARAERTVAQLVDAVGPEHVFVEVMDHGIAAERRVVTGLVDLAERFGLKMVATNDAHYVAEGHASEHDAWLCVQTASKVTDTDRFRFQGSGYHLRTADEMHRAFARYPDRVREAVTNSLAVAEMCEPEVLPEAVMRLPVFDVPAGYVPSKEATARNLVGPSAYLFDQMRAGAHRRWGIADGVTSETRVPAHVRDRLLYEFGIIDQAGLSSYFLICADMLDWCRSQGIRVGPGRGSAAGCAVSYTLGIVNVDPIANDLLFERFLNPQRTGMPDIDSDVEAGRRDEVVAYLVRRWGADRVAQLGTFSYSRSKAAIRAAARVLDRERVGDELARAIPNGKDGKVLSLAAVTDTASAAGEEYRARLARSDDHAHVAQVAAGFEGIIDKEGIHACGVVIADAAFTDIGVPTRTATKGKGANATHVRVTQWDGDDIDKMGLLKLDVLALRNLDVITAAERLIASTTGETVDGDNPPLDPNDPDPVAAGRVRAAFDLIQRGETAGLFQLEGAGMTRLAMDMAADSLAPVGWGAEAGARR